MLLLPQLLSCNGGYIVLAVVAAILFVIIISNIKIVPQARACVIERLGRYHTTWETGIHFKVPFIDRIAKKVVLMEQVADFPPQPVITKGQRAHADRHRRVLSR
jgi:regulator of protease activity HflC (stomatin/prohibitin superfamily)